MNSGIQDGVSLESSSWWRCISPSYFDPQFNLAWKLALVHKKLAPLTLLTTYSSERLPVIATMLQKTTEISEGFVKAAYQQRTDPATGEWKRDGATKQFGVNYRGSGIVLDERNPLPDVTPSAYGVLRAGDRAPSAPVRCAADEGVQKLFDVFSCRRNTVLVFSSGEEVARRVVDAVRSLPEGLSNVVVVSAPGKVHGDNALMVLELPGRTRSYHCDCSSRRSDRGRCAGSGWSKAILWKDFKPRTDSQGIPTVDNCFMNILCGPMAIRGMPSDMGPLHVVTL